MRAGKRGEVRQHRRAVAAQLRLTRGRALGVERVDDERALVELDSGEQHRRRSDEMTGEMWHATSSFGTSSVGISGATDIRLCARRLRATAVDEEILSVRPLGDADA